MRFFNRSWCKLPWTKWIRFSDGDFKLLPGQAGFYRIRPVGKKELMYIGQTGNSLRDRLKTLARETHRKEMPFNDPHTAAPNLWAWRVSAGIEYECSAAPARLLLRDRLALECYLIWQYRLRKGESPRCNLGRFHPHYRKSRGRSTGRSTKVHGKKLPRGKLNEAGGRSAPPLRSKGNPADSNWMGLRWVEDKRERGQRLLKSGLYKILSNEGRLVYVGKSNGHLINRARSHIRTKGLPRTVAIWVSARKELTVKKPLGHHFLELENDLIASYYAKHRTAPRKQFFKEK
jgi:hypothetical protein